VLYVEDLRELRSLVVSALDAVRFQVVVAAGIDAAQFLASRERFDAVVCGKASTARAVWEFICGRPTKLFVVRDDPAAALPPKTVVLPSPTPFDLASAVAAGRE
jgi:hypothetical protein